MRIAFIDYLFENFGIQYMSALLKKKGHEVELFLDPLLFDEQAVRIKTLSKFINYNNKILKELEEFRPELICISVVTDFYQKACRIAKLIKKRFDVPIVFGGIHPTSVPERVIKNDFVDMVCIGEGEYPLLELANSMSRGIKDYSIKNIWFKKNGQIIKNDLRPLIEDLDTLPMADKELYYSKYPYFNSAYFIMASRGCRYSCGFCCHSMLKVLYKKKGKPLRNRSVDNVIEELLMAKSKYDSKIVRFWDNYLNFDLDWLSRFLSEYKEKIKIPFICYLYPVNISSELIADLESSGCCEINININPWNEEKKDPSRFFFRHKTMKEVTQMVDIISRGKVNLTVNAIIGIPGQTEEDIINFLKFCYIYKISAVYYDWLRFYPNILLTNTLKEKSYFKEDEYEKLMEGYSKHIQSEGGDVFEKVHLKYIIFSLIIRFLPKKMVEWSFKNKSYKFIPAIIPCRVVIFLLNLLTFSYERRYFRKLDVRRFIFFSKKELGSFFKRLPLKGAV